MTDRPLRVLRVAPRFDWRTLDPAPPVADIDAIGGLAAQVARQAAGTAALGIQQTILTSRPPGAPARADASHGVSVRAVGRSGVRGVHRAALAWLAGVVRALSGREARRADVVHIHASGIIEPLLAALAARVLVRRPVVLTLHCSAQVTYVVRSRRDALVQVLTRAAERSAIRSAARTLVLTQRVAERLEAGQLEVMPDWVDPDRPPVPAGERLADGSSPVALYVGRLSAEKGWPALVELALALRDRGLRIVVCGDGPDRERIREAALAAGVADAFTLAGAVSSQAVAAAMAAADVLVLPSEHEELGSVLIEAMAAGLPAVAYDVGGTAEAVVPGTTGLLVPAGDTRALAAAVATVLDDGALRERARAEGPAIARERFGQAALSRRLAAVYADVAR